MNDSSFGHLDGKHVVVTGSSSGIGRAIAWELACAGADVVVHCRNRLELAEELAARIRGIGRRAEVLSADLGQVDESNRFIEDAWNSLDGIDVWVNNAGADLLTGEDSQLEFDEKLAKLFSVDVAGTMRLARNAGRKMVEGRGGVILNIGWDQADRGMGGDSGELFAAAKNAVMGFTRSLAVSLAPSVRVNCIAPGWIQTAWGDTASDYWQQRVIEETPLGRWGTPEEVAKLARFLASSDAAFITGQVINVNGGAVR
ncbi:MAG: SDR family oxidoreductase [Planctomycetaceae bacterium]|jgi:3-oxoacyl-[acyl-carrier protein] reductase|nr:SDR family oxidoreductase [Planctomycetaceae bacterium]MBT6485965.1 SDR family oxidoreductase [Planctomycetaceae bacterium]MBT6497045.1 SDR family oxidoreductase [Planctomycetaceae bacterium]